MPGPYHYPFYAHGHGRARPFLPIRFINPMTGKTFKWFALVDTGADQCIFPADLTEVLQHNLKGDDVESSITFGIEGHVVKTWLHTFELALQHPRKPEVVVRQMPPARYECSEKSHFPPILGQADFLSHYVIKLDYPLQRVSVSW